MRTNTQTVHHTNVWLYAIRLGIFAGLFWGLAKIALHFFSFTKVHPSFLAEPFFRHEFLMSWTGQLIGFLFFVAYSIVASLIYALLLRKVKGPWLGLAYGAAWWVAIYVLIGPLTGFMQPVMDWGFTSLSTDFCLFLLWGMFIGYSTAVEFTDERQRDGGSGIPGMN